MIHTSLEKAQKARDMLQKAILEDGSLNVKESVAGEYEPRPILWTSVATAAAAAVLMVLERIY